MQLRKNKKGLYLRTLEALLCISILLFTFVSLGIPDRYLEKQTEHKIEKLHSGLMTLGNMNLLRQYSSESNCSIIVNKLHNLGFIAKKKDIQVEIIKYDIEKEEFATECVYGQLDANEKISASYHLTGYYSIDPKTVYIYVPK